MNSRKKISNRRRSGASLQKTQGLLEVKVRSEMAHRQRNQAVLMWICKISLALAMVSGGIYGGRELVNRMFLKNPEYNLAAVEINDDGSALTREVILSTTKLAIGQNIFSFSLSKAREALLALPQVERVELQRALPNKITIEIAERRPVAWLANAMTADPSTSENAFLIDSKGVLFKPKRQLPEYLRLPAIYGAPVENYLAGDTVSSPEVCAALELVQKNADINRFRLQSVDLSKGYCLIATDSRRAKITFGLDDIGRQMDRLGAVLDYAAAQGKEIRTVNLMVEKNTPAVFVDPAAPEPEAGGAAEVEPKPAVKPAASPTPKASAKPPAGTSEPKNITPKPPKKTSETMVQTVKRDEPVVHRAEAVGAPPPPLHTAPRAEPARSFFGLKF